MKSWANLSVSRKLSIVIGTMAVLIAGELVTLRFALDKLSAVRAFVGGEGLWSKAQKNAAFALQRYGLTHDEQDYEAFLEAFKIPEGDHIARLEMMKPNPDNAVLHAAFLQGRIHPDDIEPMVRLIRKFHWERHLSRAIDIWAEADQVLEKFKKAGVRYHELLSAPIPDSAQIDEVLGDLRNLNAELTLIEEEFSTVLGSGSRWMETALVSLLFLAVLLVESIGLTLTVLTSRALSRGLNQIMSVASRIGKGDFTAKVSIDTQDEIGTLGRSINGMGELLETSYQELESRVETRTAELAKLADENAALYQKAIDAVRMRDEFMSIASHELKTPITALSLKLQLLARAPADRDAKVSALIESCLRQTKRLSMLSDELFDLTRLRLGKFEIDRARCDLTTIALDIVGSLAIEAAGAGSHITVDAPSPVFGDFDATRVTQIVSNLVSNAIKYGQGKPIRVSVGRNGRLAFIEVTDQGPGISKELQSQIFDRYVRASTDEKISGLGLGLYISREVAIAHGGTIALNSEPGHGATFRLELPISGGASASRPPLGHFERQLHDEP